jgi:predicted Zn-dependent protease
LVARGAGEVLAFARARKSSSRRPTPAFLDTLAAAQANRRFRRRDPNAQAALLVLALPPETPEKAEPRKPSQARLAEYRAGRPHRENAFLRLWNAMLI